MCQLKCSTVSIGVQFLKFIKFLAKSLRSKVLSRWISDTFSKISGMFCQNLRLKYWMMKTKIEIADRSFVQNVEHDYPMKFFDTFYPGNWRLIKSAIMKIEKIRDFSYQRINVSTDWAKFQRSGNLSSAMLWPFKKNIQ
jgi:hypothetical protein